ncbi:MAG: AAA family ATPase [Sediminibacterium sp.]|nr:AAA family ATPase [Sediminibacterium sp.]
MDKKELIDCINFFKEIRVVERDVSTPEDIQNHSKSVIVDYIFKGKIYTTTKLYYKNILHQKNIKYPNQIVNYFGETVYWLDNEKNDWARGAGEAELEKTIIDEMANDNDVEFKTLLKSIANNSKTGFIQKITAEGKSGQYHHNFENNNHWHDIIRLIQEIINKKGAPVDKSYFSRLVFKWDGNKHSQIRERASLAKEVEWKNRAFIDALYDNIKSIQNTFIEMEIINLLKHKGQIILQGPPGTGKTREAKKMARELLMPKSITINDVINTLRLGSKLKSATDYSEYEISKIEDTKVTLKLKTGSEYAPSMSEIIKAYESKLWLGGQSKGNDPYSAAIAKYIFENLDCSEFLKVIQFHPAYTYEDFVRGIVVKTDNGSAPEYKTVNKILGEFAKKANESNLSGGVDDFDRAWYELVQDINDGKVKKIGSSDVEVDLNSEGNIRFKTPVATYEKTYELYRFGKTDLKYETYNRIVLNFLKDEAGKYKLKDFIPPSAIDSNKPYVLIIDEINRANLPAVLGELIYALEYRGEKVESIYSTTDEGNTLVLPPNLYIIGTMNTADRSVGHIDYAIRRRFAFIDVLPKVIEGDAFERELFIKVSALFIKNFDAYKNDNTVTLERSEHLSEEFRPEDVWLGHSYFIKKNEDFELRKKYEVIPILKEYVKDGILKQSAESVINAL